MRQTDLVGQAPGKCPDGRLTEGRSGLIEQAIWQLEVCNACRYCEGFCAVFPALERRQRPEASDVYFLANLCHDCRPCYYACMYAPPHEFAVNLPRTFAEVRRHTYRRYAIPTRLGSLVHSGLGVASVAAVVAAVFFAIVVALTGDPARLFAAHSGPDSFYAVIPYVPMFLPLLIIAGWGVVALVAGTFKFWQETRGSLGIFRHPKALVEAFADALALRYMRGYEQGGCNYPDELPSRLRWGLHLSLLWGFISAFAATTLAFAYQDILGWRPPYPLLSATVILGSVGGIAMIVGATGLIYLKWQADAEPADQQHVAMDYAFLALIDVVAITGMLLLGLRDTPIMGALLIVHLASVAAFFAAAPYGKASHFIYRYAALVQNRIEGQR